MPQITLRIPTPLQPYAGQRRVLTFEAATVAELLDRVAAEHEPLAIRIRARDGSLRPYVNLFVRQTDIRELDGLATELAEGDEVIVVPSVAGG